jgi:hypothetical protein
MKTREAASGPWVRRAAVAHNLVLAAWSLAMCAGSIAGAADLARRRGWRVLFCAAADGDASGTVFWWTYCYMMSKYYELLDTVFIVIRKRPLTFLHVFHHAIVLPMVYLWLHHSLNFTISGVVFNTAVHVVMYTWYAMSLCEATRPLASRLKSSVTTMQIVQFVSSFLLSLPYLALDLLPAGVTVFGFLTGTTPWDGGGLAHNCAGRAAFLFSSQLNAGFLVLFSQFFVRSYRSRKVKTG